MASKNQGYPPGNTKYMSDFSKALAGEVRILLSEVGTLRDEKRKLQYDIAELLSIKSKFDPTGEYMPDWRPHLEAPPLEAPPPPPAIEAPHAPPGWRTVSKKVERKPRPKKTAAAPPPMIAAAPPPPPPENQMPAWAQWRPNPLLAPAPLLAHSAVPMSPPPRSGLFGPATPPPK